MCTERLHKISPYLEDVVLCMLQHPKRDPKYDGGALIIIIIIIIIINIIIFILFIT